MLSDSDIIDQVNPFVDEPPGTWSKPYDMVQYKELFDDSDADEASPICDFGKTAGDRTIDFCEPGVPNCPMSRELEPTQRVDPDLDEEVKLVKVDEDIPLIYKFAVVLLFLSTIIIASEKS